jgi:gamma-glutamylaminecyclotransferase
MISIFVYGSLMSGLSNHRHMQGASFVGPTSTVPRYRLVDLGRFPGLLEGGTTAVIGEHYVVDRALLERLDHFEGVPTFYQRKPVLFQDGRSAYGYVLGSAFADRPLLNHGDWRAHVEANRAAGPLRRGG